MMTKMMMIVAVVLVGITMVNAGCSICGHTCEHAEACFDALRADTTRRLQGASSNQPVPECDAMMGAVPANLKGAFADIVNLAQTSTADNKLEDALEHYNHPGRKKQCEDAGGIERTSEATQALQVEQKQKLQKTDDLLSLLDDASKTKAKAKDFTCWR